jgi:hypothetical protein
MRINECGTFGDVIIGMGVMVNYSYDYDGDDK